MHIVTTGWSAFML